MSLAVASAIFGASQRHGMGWDGMGCERTQKIDVIIHHMPQFVRPSDATTDKLRIDEDTCSFFCYSLDCFIFLDSDNSTNVGEGGERHYTRDLLQMFEQSIGKIGNNMGWGLQCLSLSLSLSLSSCVLHCAVLLTERLRISTVRMKVVRCVHLSSSTVYLFCAHTPPRNLCALCALNLDSGCVCELQPQTTRRGLCGSLSRLHGTTTALNRYRLPTTWGMWGCGMWDVGYGMG